MALLRREFLHGSTCSEVMGIQWLAKPDLLPVRIPQVKLRVKNLFDKLKKIRRMCGRGARIRTGDLLRVARFHCSFIFSKKSGTSECFVLEPETLVRCN